MSEEPATVTIKVQIGDPRALHAKACEAHARSGGGDGTTVPNFLGTADEPNLANCLTEILADADQDGTLGHLEFPS